MLQLVFRKMLSKKWMVACLLIGNILLVSIASSCALYENAVMQKMLTQDLAEYLEEEEKYPGTTVMEASIKQASVSSDLKKIVTLEEMATSYADLLGVEETYFVTHYYQSIKLYSDVQDDNGDSDILSAALGCYSDIADHIEITTGEMYTAGVQDGNIIEVIVPKRTFVYMNLMIGQTLRIKGVTDENGDSYYVQIVGVFEQADDEDIYWYSQPSNWLQTMVADEETFMELFIDVPDENLPIYTVEWASIINYQDFKGTDVSRILDVIDEFRAEYVLLSANGMEANFYEIFEDYETAAAKLKVTLIVLEIPIFVLLAVFIFMVSGQMLDMEQKEISIFKSRGASKKQIILLYLLQSAILAGISLMIGIPLGALICQVIGSANAFLEFVSRSALPVTLTVRAVLFAVLAALVGMATMVLPVFRYADVTIVAHKQKKAGKKKRPLWQRLFLDVILLAISLYIVYMYNQNSEYISQTILNGSSLGILMYLASSVFILGAALLVLRLFPLVVKLIFWLGKKLWPPSLYASFLEITRQRSRQGFLMVFLIMTMSLGIFNAQAAQTINQNGEDRIYYTNGADLVVQEVWSVDANEEYVEPDYSKYEDIDGVTSMTRVISTTATAKTDSGSISGVSLMGINTKEFGETAWFDTDLLPEHWYYYLNAMSQDAEGVLLSSNFHELYGLEVGDVITYSNNYGSAKGVIYGFVDYWPTYEPTSELENRDYDEENYLIVANFAQLQSEWATFPYQIWMKVEDSTAFFYTWAEENDVTFTTFIDTTADLIDWKNDPVTQGTNGVLTVGFIVVLILCAVGFLIFWILSIRSRELEFGIFRAMGMSMKEIIAMLLNEQLFISGIALVMGAVIGHIASQLFVPMVQIAYTTADTVIPLTVANAASDTMKLYVVVGVVVVACIVVLGVLISRIKISQALKLGED